MLQTIVHRLSIHLIDRACDFIWKNNTYLKLRISRRRNDIDYKRSPTKVEHRIGRLLRMQHCSNLRIFSALECAADDGALVSGGPSISDSAHSRTICWRRYPFFFFCPVRHGLSCVAGSRSVSVASGKASLSTETLSSDWKDVPSFY